MSGADLTAIAAGGGGGSQAVRDHAATLPLLPAQQELSRHAQTGGEAGAAGSFQIATRAEQAVPAPVPALPGRAPAQARACGGD
ncbi:hypothetical protein [Brevundimonas sp.]|uniref:hypothetical protein n=1 Tax=Brevundimonas sp. TaxID=1871086 RepID=UPI00391CDFB7